MSRKIKLIVIEDHRILRDSLVWDLEEVTDIKVAGSFRDGESALCFLEQNKIDVALVDIGLPGMDGLEFTRTICSGKKNPKVIILTMYEQEWRVHEALHSGATAYLSKDTCIDEIIMAVRAVYRGDSFISPKLARDLCLSQDNGNKTLSLSAEQITILCYARDGVNNNEIAKRLGVSLAGVKHRFAAIQKSMNTKDRTHAVIEAVRRGLIPIE
jgi:DNA-binding NarL/FixJ family response regulator